STSTRSPSSRRSPGPSDRSSIGEARSTTPQRPRPSRLRARPPPMAEARLAGLLEAALYYDSGDADAITELYERILGLPVVAEWPDGRALRLGSTLLLLF